MEKILPAFSVYFMSCCWLISRLKVAGLVVTGLLVAGLLAINFAIAADFADNILVIKSKKMLQLQKNGVSFATYKIALGKNPLGHKQYQGDNRTPEGVYFIEEKKTDSAFYKALKISYPNAADIQFAQSKGLSPGGQIMIHGQKNGYGWGAYVMQQRNWTQGCIALSNEDLDKVWQAVLIGTRIEILP